MFALRADRVFDGLGWVERPLVLVDEGRIVDVGVSAPADVEVVDLGADCTLLPGLVDTHQHLCFCGEGTLEEQVTPLDDDALAERAVTNARRALGGGVTTVRDLGDRGWVTLGLRDRVDAPTIVAAGPPITRSDGHCWYLGGGADDEAALRAAVAERVDRGVDVVKVMVTGGVLTAGRYPVSSTQFSLDELRLLVDDAHAAGLPVAAHCHGVAGIEAALTAGVDSIEHCSFLDGDLIARPDPGLLERLAASGIALSITIGRRPELPMPEILRANRPTMTATWGRLHELGAVLVAGSDAGINESKPHDVLPYALRDFDESSVPLLDGLRAMTSVAAGVAGLADRKGRLAAGYDADLLAVAGDPGTDAAALAEVRAVWRDGIPVSR
ncbi:MAG: amidohydrolase family protein [Desertimonas sp.]